jgi:hypothetical protein
MGSAEKFLARSGGVANKIPAMEITTTAYGQ